MIYKVVGSNHPEINKVSFRAVWKRSLIWFSFFFFFWIGFVRDL